MNSPGQSTDIETKSVHEIMIPIDRYPSVLSSCSLKNAIKVMEETQLDVGGQKSLPRALLVFDEDGNFKGCVRRRDIMAGLEPKFLVSEPIHYRMKLFDVNLDPNLSQMANRHVVKGIREQAERPVSDVTKPIETTLSYDDRIMKAMYESVVYGLNIIPVMRQGKVIGVVRSVELFHELAKLVL